MLMNGMRTCSLNKCSSLRFVVLVTMKEDFLETYGNIATAIIQVKGVLYMDPNSNGHVF